MGISYGKFYQLWLSSLFTFLIILYQNDLSVYVYKGGLKSSLAEKLIWGCHIWVFKPIESKHFNTSERSVWTIRGTILKKKPHLVIFHQSMLVSLWTFQLTLIYSVFLQDEDDHDSPQLSFCKYCFTIFILGRDNECFSVTFSSIFSFLKHHFQLAVHWVLEFIFLLIVISARLLMPSLST